MKLTGGSFQFWRKRKEITVENALDPFALSSEVHLRGEFTDPSPLFQRLLEEVYKGKYEDAFKICKWNEGKVTVNYWKVKCPYCGEEFPFEDKRVLRCPKCNNVIKKVDFETWNKKLDQYLEGEIGIKELFDSPVTPTSQGYEKLREVFLDPDIPKAEKIYRLYSPNQLFTIVEIIEEIRRAEERLIPLYSLALLDFVTYNSMFSRLKSGKIYPLSSKVSERWAELPKEYYCISLKRVLEKVKERRPSEAKVVASHPYTLDLEELYNAELFLFEWVKRPLSYSNGYSLTPRLFKEYIFNCLDEKCESFYEKDFEFNPPRFELDKVIFYLDSLDYGSLRYLLSLKDYRVSKIEREGVFRIELERGRKGVIHIGEVQAKIRREKTGDYLNDLSLALRELTSYERVLGVREEELLKVMFNTISEERVWKVLWVLNQHS